MMEMDRVLARLGARIGIPALAFDPEGSCLLEIGAFRIDLQCNADGSRLLVSCLIGELPPDDRAGAMARLLAANSLFRGTGGATLGVPAGSGAVVLAREHAASALADDALAAALEAFLAAAESIALLLASQADAAQPRESYLNMTRV